MSARAIAGVTATTIARRQARRIGQRGGSGALGSNVRGGGCFLPTGGMSLRPGGRFVTGGFVAVSSTAASGGAATTPASIGGGGVTTAGAIGGGSTCFTGGG